MPNQEPTPDIWGPQGPFQRHIPRYESRPDQRTMSEAIRRAIQTKQHLIVEAGTGIGKSLAYLAPSIIEALADDTVRIGISTATINLQQQLTTKDLPMTISAMEADNVITPGRLRWTALKGRANYLCHHRYQSALDDGKPDQDGLLSLISDWRTHTGDVAELSLSPQQRWSWSLLSAQHCRDCPLYKSNHPDCYLQRARTKARDAHIVVINHALLLSDIAASEPHLGHLNQIIIDEAHHLEQEASQQFGWDITAEELTRHVQLLVTDPMLGHLASETQRPWDDFWHATTLCLDSRRPDDPVPITSELRATPEWTQLLRASEVMLTALDNLASHINAQITQALRNGDTPRETTLRPPSTAIFEHTSIITRLMEQHDPDNIQWLRPRGSEYPPAIHSVPLRVGPILTEALFDRRDSVILTSATLASGDRGFQLLEEQVGFPSGQRLSIASPFRYSEQARLMSPSDLPNPRQWQEHSASVSQALHSIAIALDGHTLALFTSNAAIRDAARRLRPLLEPHRIHVMAQNVDGTAPELIHRFRQDPNAIILGTNSFWEGIDLGPELLHAVAICKLPFPVPSDPILSARSRLYNNPFHDYQVPIAVLRFRQGFGRLVRNHRSKGSVIILDPRIRHRSYGREFLTALPTCNYAKSTTTNIGELAREWLHPEHAAAGAATP